MSYKNELEMCKSRLECFENKSTEEEESEENLEILYEERQLREQSFLEERRMFEDERRSFEEELRRFKKERRRFKKERRRFERERRRFEEEQQQRSFEEEEEEGRERFEEEGGRERFEEERKQRAEIRREERIEAAMRQGRHEDFANQQFWDVLSQDYST
jgi:hypothetical protein